MANLQLLGVDSLQVLKLSGIETIEGKSAYQYAQDGGYTGTEEEFKLKMAQEIPTKTSQLTNDSGFLTTDNNTTYTLTKSGATITLNGSDGSTTSVTDSDADTTYSAATTSAAGLMSAEDKIKLDGLPSSNVPTLDDDGVLIFN